MTISSTTLGLLLDAGLSNGTLKAIAAAIEADVERACNALRVTLREQVTLSDAGSVTPAALRMRKMRENKRLLATAAGCSDGITERNTVTSPPVTSDNNLFKEVVIEKEESKPVVVTRKRHKYSELFEKFYLEFPTDNGMSKLEAWKAWEKLSAEDHQSAINGIPGLKKWAAGQGATYRVVHACRYLSQRRFDGFSAETGSAVTSIASQIVVQVGTAQWMAWRQHKGKSSPERDIEVNGRRLRGWWFPSEWPPGYEPDLPEIPAHLKRSA